MACDKLLYFGMIPPFFGVFRWVRVVKKRKAGVLMLRCPPAKQRESLRTHPGYSMEGLTNTPAIPVN